MTRRPAKQGTLRKDDSTFIGAWIPVDLMERIDAFVADQDLDRSKMLRRAIEEKLATQETAK
jgi:metal-responsive CopG/Arc/MetJ family transcriptional regulator